MEEENEHCVLPPSRVRDKACSVTDNTFTEFWFDLGQKTCYRIFLIYFFPIFQLFGLTFVTVLNTAVKQVTCAVTLLEVGAGTLAHKAELHFYFYFILKLWNITMKQWLTRQIFFFLIQYFKTWQVLSVESNANHVGVVLSVAVTAVRFEFGTILPQYCVVKATF